MKLPRTRLIVLIFAVLGTMSLCASTWKTACEDEATPPPMFGRIVEVAYSMNELTLADLQSITVSHVKFNPIANHSKTILNVALKAKFEQALKDMNIEDWEHARAYVAKVIPRRHELLTAHKDAVAMTAPVFSLKEVGTFDHSSHRAVQVFTSRNGSTYIGLINKSDLYEVIEVETRRSLWKSSSKILPTQEVVFHDDSSGNPRLDIVRHTQGTQKSIDIESIDFLHSKSTHIQIPGTWIGEVQSYFALENEAKYLKFKDSIRGTRLVSATDGSALPLNDTPGTQHLMMTSDQGTSVIASVAKDIRLRVVGTKALSAPLFEEKNVDASFPRLFKSPAGKLYLSYETPSETVLRMPLEEGTGTLNLPKANGNISFHESSEGNFWAAQFRWTRGLRIDGSGAQLRVFNLKDAAKPSFTYDFEQRRKKYSIGWLSNYLVVATDGEVLVFSVNGEVVFAARLPLASAGRTDDVLKIFETRDSLYLLTTVTSGSLNLYQLFTRLEDHQ